MELLCWGIGDHGQTGHGRSGNVRPEEALLRQFTSARLGSVKFIACGSSHSVVVTDDNKIFAWGNGTSGQLGHGERSLNHLPVEAKLPQKLNVETGHAHMDIADIVGVACGSRHSFIWTKTGQAYGFGNNFYAQLGYDFQRVDFKDHQLAPRLFQSLPSSLKIIQVACGERHTLFALENGTVAACGHNDYGQIGSGSNESVVVPHFVERVGPASKVTCGANHNLVLTGDGRLFNWGCGRACGNTKRNLLLPEEVKIQSLSVRDIAGGCWHSLLLTDGGNVFSWGIGQEGQLGLGEEEIHVSTPCLINHPQLTGVIRIQAGNSYSAAVTGGELLLWGQISCVSKVNDRTGFKRLWTPQTVPLAALKVKDVACGMWHMMALTTRGPQKTHCAHPESEPCFRDRVGKPLPVNVTKKDNTVQDSEQVCCQKNKLLQMVEREAPKEKEWETDEESVGAEEVQNSDEDDGAEVFNYPAVTPTSTKLETERNQSGNVIIVPNVGRGGVEPSELRHKQRRVRLGSPRRVFTTVYVLPRGGEEQHKSTSGTLPRLLTGLQLHRRTLAEAQKAGSSYLTGLVQKPECNSGTLQNIRPRPKSGPEGRAGGLGPGGERIFSCHCSRNRLHSTNEPTVKTQGKTQGKT
ncbi:ultraviolet-B receptor UVR8-like [Gouania willdenowi]|uniref:ultraviolet-B receptor UVR8-like n=1 Tax=Gouania willdenowi TaxID=441366 RepID=UPI001056A1CA|nr:ultraviolet-B receptor UVR8-like [Gouania willdenowi]